MLILVLEIKLCFNTQSSRNWSEVSSQADSGLCNAVNEDKCFSKCDCCKKEKESSSRHHWLWIYILQLETPPPPPPPPNPLQRQHKGRREEERRCVGGSLISDLGLNCNSFLGNLHSSGKGQQILCVEALPPPSVLLPSPLPASRPAEITAISWPTLLLFLPLFVLHL